MLRVKLLSIGLFVLLIGALPGRADDARDEAVKKEMKAIAGTWEATKVKPPGQDELSPPPGTLLLVIGADGKYSEKIQGNEAENGTLTVDPSKTPKTIDLMILEGKDKGKKQFGLYELKGDMLTIAFAEPGKDRPADLAGKGADAIVTFKRSK
jgi:uncharacterized protein (TIGR03067 family)